jgi:hypothetical protein
LNHEENLGTAATIASHELALTLRGLDASSDQTYKGVKDMAATITKARLLELLKDKPDNAEIYVFTTMRDVQKAVDASNKTPGEDVFFKVSGSNTLSESNGVSLIAYLD